MTRNERIATLTIGVLLLAGALGLGYRWGAGAESAPPAAADATADARRILYWYDPMVPGHKFDKPGKSPFMDMDLVPVYADEGGDDKGGVHAGTKVVASGQFLIDSEASLRSTTSRFRE